jgi:DNA-binding HxlR family transcriptional regulator
MAVLDLLGRRWTLRVLWELHQRPAGFRDLQRLCGDMSSSVLSTRLRELRVAGIVDTDEDGTNSLSRQGAKLVTALQPLTEWSNEWAGGTVNAERES